MLPESKGEFPKCLYLDQNKWIDLARAHYGRTDGEAFQDALRAVRAAVDSGRLLVPFSAVHAREAVAARDAGRRERLARFMVDLSRGVTILPESAVRPVEIRNLLRRTFNRGREVPIRPAILGRGLVHAYGQELAISGGSEEARAAALERAQSPEMTLNLLLAAANNRALIDRTRAWETDRVAAFERARAAGADAALTQEQRRAYEVMRLGEQEGSPVQELLREAQEMGVPAEEFFGRFQGDASAFPNFVHTIPTVDVLGTLLLARDRDQVRPIAANDLRDLLHLSVAVPYSNIAVLENYWGHQVRATGLEVKYGTVVITDARDLPGQLPTVGCVQ